MTTLTIRYSCALALVASLVCMVPQAHGVIIDFNNVPDGTPVSAANPYPDILELSAYHGYAPPDLDLLYDGFILWTEARVEGGLVPVESPLFGNPLDFNVTYYSRITGRFLQPVENVSLDLFTVLQGFLIYAAVNEQEQVFFGSANTQSDVGAEIFPETFNLTVPPGFFVREFKVVNQDDTVNFGGAIWLDNIRFDLVGSQSVPDAGSTGMLFAGFCITLLVFNKFKRFVRPV